LPLYLFRHMDLRAPLADRCETLPCDRYLRQFYNASPADASTCRVMLPSRIVAWPGCEPRNSRPESHSNYHATEPHNNAQWLLDLTFLFTAMLQTACSQVSCIMPQNMPQ